MYHHAVCPALPVAISVSCPRRLDRLPLPVTLASTPQYPPVPPSAPESGRGRCLLQLDCNLLIISIIDILIVSAIDMEIVSRRTVTDWPLYLKTKSLSKFSFLFIYRSELASSPSVACDSASVSPPTVDRSANHTRPPVASCQSPVASRHTTRHLSRHASRHVTSRHSRVTSLPTCYCTKSSVPPTLYFYCLFSAILYISWRMIALDVFSICTESVTIFSLIGTFIWYICFLNYVIEFKTYHRIFNRGPWGTKVRIFFIPNFNLFLIKTTSSYFSLIKSISSFLRSKTTKLRDLTSKLTCT